MKRIIDKIKGFSFVEITIVTGIMALLSVPIFSLMSKGTSGTFRNRNEILAQQYASNIIAFCNAKEFDDDSLKAVTDKIITNGDVYEITAGDNKINLDITEDYFNKIATRTITIKDFDGSDKWSCKYKLITVKVEWQQPDELKPRNVTLNGIISER